MRRKLAAGNWKMHGSEAALSELQELAASLPEPCCDVVVCPPATLLTAACAEQVRARIQIGAQDCHAEVKGAFTGDISAQMIAETGATYTIVGHSERRASHHESDAIVRSKAEAAQAAGLISIICVGESLSEREAGQALDVIHTQLAQSVPDTSTPETLVVAYEPIWAIGTGKIPSLDQIAEIHAAMRTQLLDRFGAIGAEIRLVYGGSVKAENAQAIFAIENVDGALVGGASLKAKDFAPIVTALCDS